MIFSKLLILLIVVPVVELYILIEIGQQIGAFTTIGIIVLTGIIGAYLVKNQGFMVLKKIQYDLNQNILPGDSLLQGIIILAGGIFLLTPGFITDIIGFIFLIPISREIVKKYLLIWLKRKIDSGNINIDNFKPLS
jgi:UPF0716 protein FxsA